MKRLAHTAFDAFLVLAAIAGAFGCWYIREHSIPADAETVQACRAMGDCEAFSMSALAQFMATNMAQAFTTGASSCSRKSV